MRYLDRLQPLALLVMRLALGSKSGLVQVYELPAGKLIKSLVPVPADLLRLGPDDPAALAWLWAHWGTTQALRHVTSVSLAFPDDPAAPGPDETVFRVTFWSADWTPWAAVGAIGKAWPGLVFDVRPDYGDG